jgi:hypothetical protein
MAWKSGDPKHHRNMEHGPFIDDLWWFPSEKSWCSIDSYVMSVMFKN